MSLRPWAQLTYIIKGYERGEKHLTDLATSQYRIEFTTILFCRFHYVNDEKSIIKMKFSFLLIILILFYCADDVRARRGRGRGRTKSRVNNCFSI